MHRGVSNPVISRITLYHSLFTKPHMERKQIANTSQVDPRNICAISWNWLWGSPWQVAISSDSDFDSDSEIFTRIRLPITLWHANRLSDNLSFCLSCGFASLRSFGKPLRSTGEILSLILSFFFVELRWVIHAELK